MRRAADYVVNWLLRHVPWYRPAEIEAREARTERIHQRSIAVRIESERVRDELDRAVTAVRR